MTARNYAITVHLVHNAAMLSYALPKAAKILGITDENYRTKTFVLDAKLAAYPGQFVMAWLPRFDEKPFSLVDADPVTLMVTAVGPFSNLLHRLHVGDHIWIRGPFGRGFQIGPYQRHIALVGGGYGVAPLHWLARMCVEPLERVTTVVGARTARDVLYADRFAQLVEQQAMLPDAAPIHELVTVTEDQSLGRGGLVTTVLEPLVERGEIDGIFGCGPHGMLAALSAIARRHDVPCQLSWEAYMRCAIGICGACEHDGKVLCLEGPVLQDRAA